VLLDDVVRWLDSMRTLFLPLLRGIRVGTKRFAMPVAGDGMHGS